MKSYAPDMVAEMQLPPPERVNRHDYKMYIRAINQRLLEGDRLASQAIKNAKLKKEAVGG
jgi:hypothetical protein